MDTSTNNLSLDTYVSLISASFCGAFVVRDINFSWYWGGTFFQKRILLRFGSDYGFIVHFVRFVFSSCWFGDVNRQSRLSTWFVLCSSSLFNGILTEANSGQNWSKKLKKKKKTYLNYENYCRHLLKVLEVCLLFVRTETSNSPCFQNKTSLVLLICHQSCLSFIFSGVERPLVSHYLSYSSM